MKKLLGSLIVLAAMALPALAQAPPMSPDDQAKFDNYYSRWIQDRQNGDRDDLVSSEHHMQDLMNKYAIPANTPYDQVASQNASGYDNRAYDNRDYNNRAYDNSGYANQLPGDDQNKFNKEYTKWQEANAKNDRDDIDKHARKMEDIMARYNVPPNTPFDEIASTNGYSQPRYNYRDFQRRLSPDDQQRFDKSYQHWMHERSENDRNGMAKEEGKMQEIMARYNIPQDTPFNAIATANGYAPRTDIRDYQGRFSPDDQKKFDKAYEHWLNDSRKHDRDDVARDENRMQEIMARYNIPRNVPYDALASGGRGY